MRLSRLVIATASIAALAAPALAQGGSSSGYVGLAYSYNNSTLRGLQDVDNNIVEVSGAWSIALANTIGLQVDGGFEYLDEPGDTQPFGTAHVAWRNSDVGLFGAFIGAAKDGDNTVYGGGLEGQYYFSRVTLYGSLGYGRGQEAAGVSAPPPTATQVDVDYWAARGQVRYFPMENLRIAGTLGYGSTDNGTNTISGYAVGAGAEYQLGALPLSFYGNVGYRGFDDAAVGDVESVTAGTLGIRWNFGAESLFYRDRAGATSDGFKDLLLLRSESF